MQHFQYIQHMRELRAFSEWEYETGKALFDKKSRENFSLYEPGYLLDKPFVPNNTIHVFELADRWDLSFEQFKFYADNAHIEFSIGWYDTLRPHAKQNTRISRLENGNLAVAFKLYVDLDFVSRVEGARPQLQEAAKKFLELKTTLLEIGARCAKNKKYHRIGGRLTFSSLWESIFSCWECNFSHPRYNDILKKSYRKSISDCIRLLEYGTFSHFLTEERRQTLYVEFDKIKEEYINLFGKRSYDVLVNDVRRDEEYVRKKYLGIASTAKISARENDATMLACKTEKDSTLLMGDKGKRDNSAAIIGKLKKDILGWQSALSMATIATFAVITEGKKLRSREELRAICEQCKVSFSDVQFEAWRAALPDGYCDKDDRSARSDYPPNTDEAIAGEDE